MIIEVLILVGRCVSFLPCSPCIIFILKRTRRGETRTNKRKKGRIVLKKEEDKKYQEGEFHKFLLLIIEDEKMEATKGIVVY